MQEARGAIRPDEAEAGVEGGEGDRVAAGAHVDDGVADRGEVVTQRFAVGAPGAKDLLHVVANFLDEFAAADQASAIAGPGERREIAIDAGKVGSAQETQRFGVEQIERRGAGVTHRDALTVGLDGDRVRLACVRRLDPRAAL